MILFSVGFTTEAPVWQRADQKGNSTAQQKALLRLRSGVQIFFLLCLSLPNA